MQITPEEIAETLAMVSKQHLDIRTITLGLNLRGCTHEDVNVMARKVYDRMTTAAEKLVPTAEQLEREYGIPIVNKRISVTPIAEICAATQATDLSPIAIAMDKAGKEVGVDFVGGFSALVHKGASRADNNLMESIPVALAATDNVCASVNVGSTRARHQHGCRVQNGWHHQTGRRGNQRQAVHWRGQIGCILQRRRR